MGVYTHSQDNWISRRGGFLVLLIVFHLLLVWGFKSGFAIKLIKSVTEPIKAELLKEPPPEEPPPPPPPVKAVEMPPVSVPPLLIDIQMPVDPPPIQITTAPPPPGPPSPPVYGPPAPPAPTGPPSVTTKATILQRPDIIDFYPPTSISLSEEGKSIVKICWDVKGKVLTSEIADSSGKKRLDDAAIKYGMRMKMRPGTTDGQPYAACATQPVVFTLKDMK